MSVAHLLSRLEKASIQLWLDGEELRYRAPKGALTVDLRDEIAAHKAEIVRFLARSEDGAAALTVKPLPRGGDQRFLASFAQQRLWFLSQLDGAGGVYNMIAHYRLDGALDREALIEAFHRLTARHEGLRTTFALVDGAVYQQIGASRVGIELVDLSEWSEAQRQAELERISLRDAHTSFDLSAGPLWSVTLVRLGEREHALLWTMHHIISDGWSIGILFRELSTLYGQPMAELPELRVHYADYAAWQREWLRGQVLAEQLTFWTRQLADAPQLLSLPTDHPRPAVLSDRGHHVAFNLSEALTRDLERLSRDCRATLFMTLQTAFAVLLSRYSGQTDVLVGTPIANRQIPEAEGLVGLFLNALVLRNDLSGRPSFRDALARAREVALDAYQHQSLPFEMIVEALQPERSLAHSPIFQVMFNLLNTRNETLDLPGVRMTPIDVEYAVAKNDLVLTMKAQSGSLSAVLEYSVDLFEQVTVERMAGHFRTLLEGIVANPDCPIALLPLLTAAERHQLVVAWNDTPASRPDTCFHRLFEERVREAPQAVAVLSTPMGQREIEALTYAALNARANQLARHLRALGVGDDALVGVCLERSAETLVSMLAIFKAGGAYIPLDPSLPDERIAYMIGSSGAKVVLTRSRHVGRLSACPATVVCVDTDHGLFSAHATDDLDDHATPQSLAYVLFTSGSTGRPKAVMIEHRGMLNNQYAKIEDHGMTAETTMAQTAPPSFDVSVWQFLAALLVGGRVRIFEDDIARDPARLMAHVEAEGVTILEVVPSFFRFMLDEIAASGVNRPSFARLRWLSLTGEALPPDLCNSWFAHYPRIPILNAYGPAECSDDSTHHVIREPLPPQSTTVSIGRRIPNVRLYALDAERELVPVGVPGELYIGGVGVGRGYVNDPEQTARVFLDDPFASTPGARMYRTGDSVRYSVDGSLEFLGRLDAQVKIRGVRVELGEIEALLKQDETIQDAVAAIRTGQNGEEQLIAYVTLSQPGDYPLRDNALALEPRWRDFMAKHLPSYMIPDQVLLLDAIPLTPNGKIDHKRLPSPEPARRASASGDEIPRTPTEEALAAIWRDVLSLERVGRQDNFFEIGGHSLLATVVVSRIRRAFEIELPLRHIFSAPTVAALAEHLEPLLASRMVQRAVVDDAAGREEISI